MHVYACIWHDKRSGLTDCLQQIPCMFFSLAMLCCKIWKARVRGSSHELTHWNILPNLVASHFHVSRAVPRKGSCRRHRGGKAMRGFILSCAPSANAGNVDLPMVFQGLWITVISQMFFDRVFGRSGAPECLHCKKHKDFQWFSIDLRKIPRFPAGRLPRPAVRA